MSFKVFKREKHDEIICFGVLVFNVDHDGRLLSVGSLHGSTPPNKLVIPSVLPSGHKISAIASGFRVYSACTLIEISDDISVIEKMAFSSLGGVLKIVWPKSCAVIPERCFEYDSIRVLEGIEDVKTIKKAAFRGCNIERITIPSKVTKIPSGTFKTCGKLVEIVLHDDITKIDTSAFWGCKISEIHWPSKCTAIPKTCFKCCHKLVSVKNIENVTTIGKQAFSSTSLTSFNWPKQCKEIPEECFMASKIADIDGINDVETVGLSAFSKCKRLKKIKWSSKAGRIPYGCFTQTLSLREIEIPDTVHTIDDSAFLNSGLTTIKWPSACAAIPNFCFYKSMLETIAGIENINSIGYRAFADTSIRSLDLSQSHVFSISSSAFYNVDKDKIVFPYYLGDDEIDKTFIY